MKQYKLFFYAAIVASLLGLMSCSKSFLDVPPQGLLQISTDDSAVNDLVTGVYSSLIYINPSDGYTYDTHGVSFIAATNIMSDDADKGSTAGDQPDIAALDNFTTTSSNSFVASLWNGYYVGIARCNQALATISTSTVDAGTKARLSGEVRFIRAYYYFNLVRFFGDVPKILVVPTSPQQVQTDPVFSTRVAAADIYSTVIIPDLQFAEGNLPLKVAAPAGRITKGAAQTLLAKVYLYQKNWGGVLIETQSVLSSNQYHLDNYVNLWRQVGDNGPESIFEIETAENNNKDGGIPDYCTYQGPRNNGGTWNNPADTYDPHGDLGFGFCVPTTNLINTYEPGDVRKNATIIFIDRNGANNVGATLFDGYVIPAVGTQDIYYNYKAYHSEISESFFNDRDHKNKNVHLLRLGEVYLMEAEALNETGHSQDAIDTINHQIRSRAGLPPSAVPVTQDSVRAAIYKERRLELAMEHDRFFDIVRQGNAAAIMHAAGKTNFVAGKHELLPIPFTQIQLSGGRLTQNNGY
jgi:hypothetical protein